MHFSRGVVKYRIPILILTLLLMIPSVLGMIGTRINYDMLNYLPSDMDTVIGQEELLEDFGKGAFSLIIVEDMTEEDTASLVQQLKQVEQFKKLENKKIPDGIDFSQIHGLRLEARQKLAKFKPHSIGQASRISGVSPSDINVLLIYLSH